MLTSTIKYSLSLRVASNGGKLYQLSLCEDNVKLLTLTEKSTSQGGCLLSQGYPQGKPISFPPMTLPNLASMFFQLSIEKSIKKLSKTVKLT